MKRQKILVNLKTYQRKWPIKKAPLQKYVEKAWLEVSKKVKVPENTELTIAFLNNRQIQDFNRTYRKKNYPTDILSFPVNEVTLDQDHYLGDMLISVEKAADQARSQGHPLGKELQILLLHGILHLLGYDHESDSGQMDRIEKSLRKSLQLN
jgi:probable rRNA maturation factor